MGMLSSYRRLYLTFFAQDNGRMRAKFDVLEPTGAGAMVAMLTRDTHAIEFEIVTDPTKDPALRGPAGKDGADGKNGQNGTNGTNGDDGLSAYQLARQQGYGGTLTQWLTTLVGAAGKDGTNGTNGSNGRDGTNGANGKDAASVLGSVTIAETNIIGITAGVRRRVVTATFDVPTGATLLLLPKAPPPVGYIVQAAWAITSAKPRELTVDLTVPAITILTSYSIDCWLVRLNA